MGEVAVWSWVTEPVTSRPEAVGPGRYSRPLSVRDQAISVAFGQEVRRLRLKAALSTRQLAQIVGLSQPWIVNIETKPRANIELRLMWDFAEALEVAPDHFLRVCEEAIAHSKSCHFAPPARGSKK